MFEETNDTFLYFAYGSNLLKTRIRINNPTAEFLGIGRLEDHHLDFIKYSEHWRGASATIVPTKSSHIWGAIWRLSNKDLPALDKQEGVESNWYFAKTVHVITPDGFKVQCRTYQQTINPLPLEEGEELPLERRPCITYLDCIINGAKECELPPSYIAELKKIPHNGQLASAKMIEKLNSDSKKNNLGTAKMMKSEINKPNTFLYFSYGGNLLTFRIHMHAPSAEFVSIARLDVLHLSTNVLTANGLCGSNPVCNLQNYRLDFIKYSSFWGGPTAALVPTANAHVWGVIWRLHEDDSTRLNDQKGVEVKKYYMKYVKVLTPYMGLFTCRVYTQKVIPLPRGDNDEIPVERWPSWTYKEIMILGAKEHEMPEYYIKNLKKLKHNGEEGALRTVCLLIRYANNEPCECRVPGKIPRKPLKLDLKELKEKDDQSKTKKKKKLK